MAEKESPLFIADSNKPPLSPVKQVLRNFCYLLFFIVIAAATSQFFAKHIDERYGTQNRWIKTRIKQALDFLNSHDSENSIYVWGTSEVESGFKPIDLEKKLCPAGTKTPKIFNFGFRDFNPYQMNLFFEHWKKPKSLPLINIVKINPVHLTRVSARRIHTSIDEVWEDLATPKEILFTKDWFIGNRINMFWAKEVLGGITPGSLHTLLLRDSLTVNRTADFSVRKSLWGDSKTHPYPAWDLSLQGFHDRSKGLGSSVQYVQELKKRQSEEPELSTSFQYHYAKTGLDNPEIHLKLRNRYIAWIKQLKERSTNLILFYTPEHPQARTVMTQKKFSALLKKISRATGVPVIDFSEDPRFKSPDFFYDAHHFTEKGEQEFTEILNKMIRDEISPERLQQFCEAAE